MADPAINANELKAMHWKRFRYNALIFLIAGLGFTMFSIGTADNPYVPLLMVGCLIVVLAAWEYTAYWFAKSRFQS